MIGLNGVPVSSSKQILSPRSGGYESRLRSLELNTSLRRQECQSDAPSNQRWLTTTSGTTFTDSDDDYDMDELSTESVALSRQRAMHRKKEENKRRKSRGGTGKEVARNRQSLSGVARAQVSFLAYQRNWSYLIITYSFMGRLPVLRF